MQPSAPHANDIFDKVVHIGPDIQGQGGIAAVLNAYRAQLPRFRYIRTNSRRGFLPGLWAWGTGLGQLAWLRIAHGCAIAHVHSGPGKSFRRKSTFMTLARLLGMKVVFHCHAGAIRVTAQHIGEKKFKRIIGHADHIISLSQQWHQYFADELGMPRVSVLPNMCTWPVSHTTHTAGEPLHMLYLGVIVEAKGVFDLVRAIADHQDSLRGRYLLHIGGNGADYERLQAHIDRAGIADMVTLLGWVGGADKERQMAWAHVVTLPSYFEGLPISLLEAMAGGKGIVATDVGGIPEIVHHGHNGLLVPAGKPEDLYQAIKAYIDHPELVERHGQASLTLLKPYLPQNVVAALRTLYGSL